MATEEVRSRPVVVAEAVEGEEWSSSMDLAEAP